MTRALENLVLLPVSILIPPSDTSGVTVDDAILGSSVERVGVHRERCKTVRGS